MDLTATESDDSPIGVGDAVKHVGTGEVGIVIWQWDSDGTTSDNYVAFFGDSFPTGKPPEKPCVLRYYSTSLTKVDAPG